MGAIRIFWVSARPLRPKISEMPAVAAGKARAQFCRCWWRFHQKQRLGEKRGHRIGRHPLGLKSSWRHASSATMRTMISDTVVARSARNGAKKDDRMAFCMVLGHFLSETQPNCCRVFSSLLPGYCGLSLSVGLLVGDAQARS